MGESVEFKKGFKKLISYENKLIGMYSPYETEANNVPTVYGGYDNAKLYKKVAEEYCQLMPYVRDPSSDEDSAYFLYSYGVFMERYSKFDKAYELFKEVYGANGAYRDSAAEQLAVLALRRGDEVEARRLCDEINDKKRNLGYPESLYIKFEQIQESAAISGAEKGAE